MWYSITSCVSRIYGLSEFFYLHIKQSSYWSCELAAGWGRDCLVIDARMNNMQYADRWLGCTSRARVEGLNSVNTFLFFIIGLPIEVFAIFSVIPVDCNRFLNIQYLEQLQRATVFCATTNFTIICLYDHVSCNIITSTVCNNTIEME